MPEHVRRQIREEVANVLRDLPTTGANVFSGRTHELNDNELPGIVITTAAAEGERSEVSSFGAAVKLDRTLRVAVLGFASGEYVENALDQIALEVEQAIAAAQENSASALMALVKDVRLMLTQISIASENSQRAGQIRLTYEMDYRTVRSAPQTAIA